VIDRGEGPAVVLLPSDAAWQGLIHLLEPWMRVVVPEETDVAVIGEELRRLGIEEFAAVGFDEGGWVAQELALGGGVRTLVLIGTPEAPGIEALPDLPVFLLWGEDDEVVPAADGERLAGKLPGSTLALIPGCGHDVLSEAGDAIFPLVFEYLRARYLGRKHGHERGPVKIEILTSPPERP